MFVNVYICNNSDDFEILQLSHKNAMTNTGKNWHIISNDSYNEMCKISAQLVLVTPLTLLEVHPISCTVISFSVSSKRETKGTNMYRFPINRFPGGRPFYADFCMSPFSTNRSPLASKEF